MKRAPRWKRRVELILWIAGITLLGFALGATLNRRDYQAQQELALFHSAAAADPAQRRDVAAPASPNEQLLEERRRRPSDGDANGDVRDSSTPADVQIAARSGHGVERTPPIERGPWTGREEEQLETAADPDAIGRIEIPRLGLAAIVRNGADEATLSRAVGLVPGTARPGEQGNTVLAAHRDTFFRPLRKIKLNDRIRIVVPPAQIFEYSVESFRIVTPEETNVLESKGIDELTLVTCYPFNFIGSAPDRFIVSARRVN